MKTQSGIAKGLARTQAERSQEAKASLIDAALAILSERGLAGLTLAEVARHSRFSRSLALYHFKSKIGLVDAVMDAVYLYGTTEMAATGAREPFARIEALIDAVKRAARARPHIFLGTIALLIEGSASEDAAIRRRIRRHDRIVRRVIEGLIREGVNEGVFSPASGIEGAATLLLAAFHGIQVQAFVGRRDFDTAGALTALKLFVRRLLAT